MNVLNEQKLVARALDPDIAEGKRSFLPGGLAVLGVWRLNDGGDGVAAAVTGLNVDQPLTSARLMLKNGDGGIFHRKLASAGEDTGH